jgi:hypothetical protein
MLSRQLLVVNHSSTTLKLRLRTVRFARATAPAAALVYVGAAQTEDFAKRLAEGNNRGLTTASPMPARYLGTCFVMSAWNIRSLASRLWCWRTWLSTNRTAAETALNHGLAAFHSNLAADPTAIMLKTHPVYRGSSLGRG